MKPKKGFKTGMGARRRLLRVMPREAVRELERAAQAPPEDPSCSGVECQPEVCGCWCHCG